MLASSGLPWCQTLAVCIGQRQIVWLLAKGVQILFQNLCSCFYRLSPWICLFLFHRQHCGLSHRIYQIHGHQSCHRSGQRRPRDRTHKTVQVLASSCGCQGSWCRHLQLPVLLHADPEGSLLRPPCCRCSWSHRHSHSRRTHHPSGSRPHHPPGRRSRPGSRHRRCHSHRGPPCARRSWRQRPWRLACCHHQTFWWVLGWPSLLSAHRCISISPEGESILESQLSSADAIQPRAGAHRRSSPWVSSASSDAGQDTLGVLLVVLVEIAQRIPDIALVVLLLPHVERASESRTDGDWSEGVVSQLDVVIVQALHGVPSNALELWEDQVGTFNGDTTSSPLALSAEQIQPSPVWPIGLLRQALCRWGSFGKSRVQASFEATLPLLTSWPVCSRCLRSSRRPERPVIHLHFLLQSCRRSRQERWRSSGGSPMDAQLGSATNINLALGEHLEVDPKLPC